MTLLRFIFIQHTQAMLFLSPLRLHFKNLKIQTKSHRALLSNLNEQSSDYPTQSHLSAKGQWHPTLTG